MGVFSRTGALSLAVGVVAGLVVVAAPTGAAPPASTAAPASSPAIPTTSGQDFWLAVPRAPLEGDRDKNALYVASPGAGAATITVPGISFSTTVNLAPGAVEKVSLPEDADVPPTTGTSDRGVHVVSDTPVSVYFANSGADASTGYVGLPVEGLGTRYRVLSYTAYGTLRPSFYGASYLIVVGTVDGTSVDITPPGAGSPTNITLDKGQTYIYALESAGDDLTGALVTSNQPVAVFGGAMLAQVPSDVITANPLVQQLPPTEAWGSEFLSVRLANRTKGDTYRVLADQDNTVVTVDGQQVATIDAGGFWEGILPPDVTTAGNQGTVIQTSKPALVAQFGNGQRYDFASGTDPLMMLIPPYQQYLNDYLFALPDVPSMGSFHINVVAPTTAIPALRLNGNPIDAAEFAAIGNTGFSGAQLNVSPGNYRLRSPQSFGANVYEWGHGGDQPNFDGLGFPGGMSLAPIGRVASITLSATSATGKVGTSDPPCVTARVLDSQGQPIAGIPVQFQVTDAGANNQLVTAVSDSQGNATTCLIGSVAASGKLIATAGAHAATSNVTWSAEPSPTPTPTPDGKKPQKPANGKGKPPARVKKSGVTMIAGANPKTNAGQRIRTRVRCVPIKAAAAGETRYCTVKRSANGMVMLTTYGKPVRVIVLQRAAPTTEYKRYFKRTVYVNGKKR